MAKEIPADRDRPSRRAAGRRAGEAAAPQAEVVEEAKAGIDTETGLVLLTTLCLFSGIVVLLVELAKHYDAGPFG